MVVSLILLCLRSLSLITPLYYSLTHTCTPVDQRFINKVFDKISHLQKRIEKCQANLDAIKQSINAWGKVPLFQRKDLNPKALLGVEPRQDIIAKRVKQANDTKELIDKLMYENAKLFFDIPQRYVIEESSEAFEEEDGEERPTPNITAVSPTATAAGKALPEAKRFTQQANDGIEEASSEGEVCKYILLYNVSQGLRLLYLTYFHRSLRRSIVMICCRH